MSAVRYPLAVRVLLRTLRIIDPAEAARIQAGYEEDSEPDARKKAN